MQAGGLSISTKILTVFCLALVWTSGIGFRAAIAQDTTKTTVNEGLSSDTVEVRSNDAIKSKVRYSAEDSMRFDIVNEKVYLYGNAKVDYEDISLSASFINVDWTTREVIATYTLDSAGNDIGLPVFRQGNDEFTARVMRYNVDSRKGKIMEVYTQQGEGFIHGETIKKIDDKSYFIRHGKYTTCDLPHPHFSISANKLKIIQDNKVVTGPAYLVIADVPTPFAIPFGYFPTRKGRSSGILFPTFGESGRLGFFFKEAGYYFGIGDYVDFAVTGDIYTLGSWATRLYSNYASRYKFNGNVALSYSKIRDGEPDVPGSSILTDFFVRWNHRQDPKANPSSVFSANVNFGSSDYFSNNISTASNYLTNTFQSSIAWNKFWPTKPYSLSLSATHSQNTITRDVTLSIPNANFSVNRFYPLQRKNVAGGSKWYEKLGISYQTNLLNTISTKDTLLFKEESQDQFRSGMSHSVPVSTSLKVLKYFTLSPSINYNENWYLETIRKNYDENTNSVVTDTVNGFRAARYFNVNASMNTRIYGMMQFAKGKVAAVRHVLTPTVSFNYRPDFSSEAFNSYKEVQTDSLGNTTKYSIFETGIFGGPPSGRSGVIGFSLDNNIEMKTRSVSDTAVTYNKVKLFESLNGGISYNLAADSLNWSNLNINARTVLLDKVNLDYSGSFDLYALDAEGRRINTFEFEQNRKLARMVSSRFAVGYRLSGKSDRSEESKQKMIRENLGPYLDMSVPFNLTLNYNLVYSKPGLDEATVNQTINAFGDLTLTPNWKLTFNTGYDFTVKDLSYTSVGIYRDLHCWEMRLNWVPFGFQQNYNFQINVKSSILQDLKLTKKNDIYD